MLTDAPLKNAGGYSPRKARPLADMGPQINLGRQAMVVSGYIRLTQA
jgi:hypothetical protein